MKHRKTFNPVKHIKSLSRSVLKPPPGRPIPPKKQKLLKKLVQQEIREELKKS